MMENHKKNLSYKSPLLALIWSLYFTTPLASFQIYLLLGCGLHKWKVYCLKVSLSLPYNDEIKTA